MSSTDHTHEQPIARGFSQLCMSLADRAWAQLIAQELNHLCMSLADRAWAQLIAREFSQLYMSLADRAWAQLIAQELSQSHMLRAAPPHATHAPALAFSALQACPTPGSIEGINMQGNAKCTDAEGYLRRH
eukprot:1145792-Pelagomonas_calceolata.AAC.6